MEDGFRPTSVDFRDPPPVPVTRPRSPFAANTVAHKIDVNLLVCGPMTLEVFQKEPPIEREVMALEVPERKGEAVVDPDECRAVFREKLCQPFGDSPPGPVFAGAGRGLDLNWRRCTLGHVDAQSPEARSRRLCSGVVNPDVALKCRHDAYPLFNPPTKDNNRGIRSEQISGEDRMRLEEAERPLSSSRTKRKISFAIAGGAYPEE